MTTTAEKSKKKKPKAKAVRLRNKHMVMDQTKIDKVRKIFNLKSDTEAVDKALEKVLADYERVKISWQATETFIHSMRKIVKDDPNAFVDVYNRATESTFK